jgi:hypothetical protein
LGNRRKRVVAAWVLAALLVPGLVALARYGARILPGKRLERRGDGVVTVPAPRPSSAGQDQGGSGRPARVAPQAGWCGGVGLTPSDDLQAAIDVHPAGTRFCLAAGTYTVSEPIRPESGDVFVGAGASAAFVVASSAPAVFDASGTSGVEFRRLAISGAVGGESCKPECGRGISGGADLLVYRARLHDNDTAGIGGTDGGMRIVSSEIDHNGSEALIGCCAAGVKSANAYTIVGSSIHDNIGVGVWCDVGCAGTFLVLDNVITHNVMGGVRYEISPGPAVIRGNTVTGNNLHDQGGHGGIEINSSRNVVIENNVLGGNAGAGIIANGNRSPSLGDVVIRNNELAGDELSGCGDGVVCDQGG